MQAMLERVQTEAHNTDYQDNFVVFEHGYEDPRSFEAVCMKCFINTPTLWCTDPECD